MFHTMHPDWHGSTEIGFRLRLLKFAVFFVRRSSSSQTSPSLAALQRIRRQHLERAHLFRLEDQCEGLVVMAPTTDPLEKLQPTETVLSVSGTSPEHCKTPGSLSLLDTLPAFMALSAAQKVSQESTISELWMRLAAGYMAQAYIEQVLVHGLTQPDILLEAFAWGFDAGSGAEEGSEEWQINVMFWSKYDVVAGWDGIRNEHIQAVSTRVPSVVFIELINIIDTVGSPSRNFVACPPTGTSI